MADPLARYRMDTDEQDGRVMLGVLTPKGYEKLRTVAPQHVGSVREHFIDRLSDAGKYDMRWRGPGAGSFGTNTVATVEIGWPFASVVR